MSGRIGRPKQIRPLNGRVWVLLNQYNEWVGLKFYRTMQQALRAAGMMTARYETEEGPVMGSGIDAGFTPVEIEFKEAGPNG